MKRHLVVGLAFTALIAGVSGAEARRGYHRAQCRVGQMYSPSQGGCMSRSEHRRLMRSVERVERRGRHGRVKVVYVERVVVVREKEKIVPAPATQPAPSNSLPKVASAMVGDDTSPVLKTFEAAGPMSLNPRPQGWRDRFESNWRR